jgi:hypothetical protein
MTCDLIISSDSQGMHGAIQDCKGGSTSRGGATVRTQEN